MPKVSVIIPTFNCSQYVSDAIDSVLDQSFNDTEIIVVDDGSTDDTKKILDKYSTRIRYLYQTHRGPSAARNRGIKNASGEYIAFLDADDIWLNDKLSLQCNILDLNQDVALVFTDLEQFDNSGVVKKSSFITTAPLLKSTIKYKILQLNLNDCSQIKGDFYKDLLMGNLICTPTVLLRRSCINKVGNFNEKLSVAEDYELWLRVAQAHSLVYLNRVTVKSRVRAGGLSGPLGVREYRYRRAQGEIFENYFKNQPDTYPEIIKKNIVNAYRVAAWGYFDIGNDLSEARRLSIKSLKYNKIQPKLYVYILVSFLPIRIIRWIKRKR